MSFLKKVAIVAEKMDFKADVQADVYGKLPGINFDYHALGTRTYVEYSISLDVRKDGIKSIDVYVPDQTVGFEVENMDEVDEDDENKTTEVKLPLKGIKVSFVGVGDHTSSLRVVPTTLSIHDGKAELIFE